MRLSVRAFSVLSAAAVVLLATAVAAGAARAPEGHYGSANERAEGSNPSLGGKLIGYRNYVRAAGHAPSVLVIGSSRGMAIDPRVIAKLSGKRSYNASVSDAGAREVLAISSFAQLLTPEQPPHLVIFLDVEMFDNRAATKRVRTVIRDEDIARRGCTVPLRCAAKWTRATTKITKEAAAGLKGRPPISDMQRADGLIKWPALARLERQGVSMTALRNRRIGLRIASYSNGAFPGLMPVPKAAVRRSISIANSYQDQPVVVLTGMHPECIRRCGPAGWSARRRAAVAWLRSLQPRLDFRLYDFTNPKTWNGSGASFYEEIHLRPKGAEQVVRALHARQAFVNKWQSKG